MSGIILALDYPSAQRALEVVELLGDRARFYKVGLELFSREGPRVVEQIHDQGKEVFLDLKLHDIPQTVAGAVAAAAAMGVRFLTLHVAGGAKMMEAAAEAAGGRVRLLGVTFLTSLPASAIPFGPGGVRPSAGAYVRRLAGEARDAGLDGVVASPLEASALRRRFGDDLLLVTPGIRLPSQARHDQRRVATPRAACEAGADYLVVGRAVTGDRDPRAALRTIVSDMARAARPAG